MQIPSAESARHALLEVAGPEQYRRFLLALNGRCQGQGRLYFWQEVLWQKVEQQLGLQAADFTYISAVFRYCHVHNQELQPQMVPIVYGTYQGSGGYIEAKEQSFPYANEKFHGPCWQERPTKREVFFCQGCRESKSKWVALTNP